MLYNFYISDTVVGRVIYMEINAFYELYERIQTEPSILLLGQGYLMMGGEKDPVWEKLVSELYPELNLSRKQVDYPNLWQHAVVTSADIERVMDKIAEAGIGVWKNHAVATVEKLRWSLLYTSAIDDTEAMATATGYSPVPPGEKNANSKYLNKNRRFRVNLCGSREFPPPLLGGSGDKINQKAFNKQIANKISWISNSYLEYYGVLVIDGFHPDYDWLNDSNLFEQLIEMPIRSVYWFSAPEQLEENASLLVERGILITDEDGLYDHLFRYMPELLESDETASLVEEDNTLYASLTLRLRSNQIYTVRIRRSDITDITGSNLCVIDDDIINGRSISQKSRTEKFAEFLTQDGLPSWHLFSLNGKSDEKPFYIPRDQDETLEKQVSIALKDTGTARKPVILCGPSNSGKSMMLANLAWTIAKRRKYPVIFIRGDLLSGAEGRLDKFIDNWLCDADRFGGERPDKIVVVWDGSGLKRTEADYERLQKLLFNRNVQVVGSVYSSTREYSVKLQQDLSSKEEKHLHSILATLGEVYVDRFKEIQRNQKTVETLKNSSLLYLLQALFKFEFDAEYRDLANILTHQFNQERTYAEQETCQSLQEYVDNFFLAQKKRAQDGVASSFQEQLKLILARMAVESQQNSANQDGAENEQMQKLEKLKHLSHCIADINEFLAVASEFGVQLPLHLLLKLLRDKNGSSYVLYDEEPAKIIQILRTDTLIDFTYRSHHRFGEEYYVSFRNSIEAENYICLLCGLPLESHSEMRREKEKEILMRIIKTAESDIDLWSVIELVRQFGPKGHGMLSEIGSIHNDYLEYKDYWLDIARTMIEQFPDDPETALVYGHLTREFISREPPEHRAYYDEDYRKARTVLETALGKIEDSTAQYYRLSVELCANYQQTLRENFSPALYEDIKRRIRAAFHRSKQRDAGELRRDFSSNYMLDILLNAYKEFSRTVTLPSAGEAELAEILFDIDSMFNLDDFVNDGKKQNQALIRKIKEIYEQLGSGSAQMEKLEKDLIRANSDALLYIRARRIWQEDSDFPGDDSYNQDIAFLAADRYMVICRDMPYTSLEVPDALIAQTRKDAQRAVSFLKEQEEVIWRTRSERCIAMLLRAKWFLKAGSPMLSEKQRVPLNLDEWTEINSLCDRYLACHGTVEPFIPAYFLKGVYEWVYGDGGRAIKWFNEAKSYANDNSARSIDRLILCKENSTISRTFLVSVEQNELRKYTAKIIRETTPEPDGTDAVITRYGIGIREPVIKYLFDGAVPKEKRQQAKKEGVVRFNLIGAQIGIPQTGGMTDDQ